MTFVVMVTTILHYTILLLELLNVQQLEISLIKMLMIILIAIQIYFVLFKLSLVGLISPFSMCVLFEFHIGCQIQDLYDGF